MWRARGGRSRLTWRRLGVLIDGLPPESRTKTAIRDAHGAVALAQQAKDSGGGDDGWGSYSNSDMHIAALIDEIRWLRHAVYHAQGAKPKRPKQYPRPGVMPERIRKLNPEAHAYLARLREQRAAKRPQPEQVPAHIADAAHRRLGPAEKQWLGEQLAAMRASRTTSTPPPPPTTT